MKLMAHHAKALAWTERRFPPRYRKAAKVAGLCVAGLLVVNEVRGVVMLVTLGPPAVVGTFNAVLGLAK